jgi:hypothetical protein
MSRRQAAMSRERASSDKEDGMARFDDGGSRSERLVPVGNMEEVVKWLAKLASGVMLATGVKSDERTAGMDLEIW